MLWEILTYKMVLVLRSAGTCVLEQKTLKVCTTVYEERETEVTATSVDVKFDKKCDNQMVTVCQPQQDGYRQPGYGTGGLGFGRIFSLFSRYFPLYFLTIFPLFSHYFPTIFSPFSHYFPTSTIVDVLSRPVPLLQPGGPGDLPEHPVCPTCSSSGQGDAAQPRPAMSGRVCFA